MRSMAGSLNPLLHAAGIAIILCAAAFAADAPERYRVSESDLIEISVPENWRAKEDSSGPMLTIWMGPAGASDLNVQLSPIPERDINWDVKDAQRLRQQIAGAMQLLLPQAVEQNPPLIEIKGQAGSGLYFSLTDKAPKPGEFKYVTQGMLPVGGSLVTFTILTNDGQDDIVRKALNVVAGAKWVIEAPSLSAPAPDRT